MAYKFSLGTRVLSGNLVVSGNISASGGGPDHKGALSGAFGLSGSSLHLGGLNGPYYINDNGHAKLDGIVIGTGKTIGAGSDPDMLTLTQADNITVASNVSFVVTAGKFEIGDGNAVTSTATELNLLDAVTRGSIIYGNASGVSAKLAKGSANTILSSDGTDISYTTVATGMIADNAVSLAKMAGLARGKIIIGDASGDPAALAAGANGKLLVADANGDLTWTTVSGDVTLSAGAVTIADDAVETDMIADNQVTLAKMAGLTRGSLILGDSSGDPSALAKGTAAQFLQSDGTDPSYVSISGDATVAAGGALTIAANAVEGSMLNNDVISAQTELAADGLVAADELMISDGGVLKKIGVDTIFTDGPGLLTAAAIDVSADHFMFLDGGATGDAKTESIVDLASAMAGSGLTATNGVLSADAAGTPTAAANGTQLSEGFNYLTGTVAGALTVSLPEAGSGPTVGDVYYLKTAAGVDGTRTVTLACSGAHSIDGVSSIVLESPYSAVSVVYMTSGSWSIF